VSPVCVCVAAGSCAVALAGSAAVVPALLLAVPLELPESWPQAPQAKVSDSIIEVMLKCRGNTIGFKFLGLR